MKHVQKVILFGGTFDPIHNGHLHVALHTLNAMNADELIFIPAGRSPHKQIAPTSGAHRMKMIEIAIENQPKLSVCDCELNRPAPSYTLDTINFFKKQFGEGVDLHWLIGADQLDDFDKWYRIDDLLDSCKMTVMYRAGYPKPD
ncbi:MAG: nicotinate (nicotinamide) nucleotide adenylyltransferase, partial [Planctomycetota bacterium]